MSLRLEYFKKKWLKDNIPFRFHMFIVTTSAVLLGVFSNKIFLEYLEISRPVIRYPLTVTASYLWFLVLVKVYIKFLFRFGIINHVALDAIENAPLESLDFDGYFKKVEKDKNDWKLSDLFDLTLLGGDLGAILLIILVLALLPIAAGSSIVQFLWFSPELLSEICLQLILVSRMKKRMKHASSYDWLHHVFTSTRRPFLLALLVSLCLGYLMR